MADSSHVLVITVDEQYARSLDLHDLDNERESWDWQIECPHNGSLSPDRYCRTYWECRCKLTEEQIDDLQGNGTGPCPVSPTGQHEWVTGADITGPAHLTQLCWLREEDGLADEIEDLITRENLRPGRHPINATIHFDYTELSLQARSTA